MPTRVSACIICVNEEANIRACLESVRFCDEIVVVDSGSKDRTLEIARELTDRITVREWPGHIQQKNFAIAAATNDWVLSIDADERVTDELRAAIQAVLQADPPARAGWEVARRTFHLGRFFRFGGWYPDRKVRLFEDLERQIALRERRVPRRKVVERRAERVDVRGRNGRKAA